MSKLKSQQKIIEFLNEEFAKIKTQQQFNKKLKLKAIEKMVRKLLNDIELVLRINSFDDNMNFKIIDIYILTRNLPANLQKNATLLI